ncbi:hypothetical protein K439DRAFT_1620291 [Ramaria rubella]|nr:hypothetical protein K439DRAFT_1620291 [Ramaria rubella]
MSAQEELASIIQGQYDFMAQNYVLVAAFTYDTLLTFPSEIKSSGTILYLLARYPALLQLLLGVYLDFETFPSLQTYSTLDLLPLIGVQGHWPIVCKSICYIQSQQTGFCNAFTVGYHINCHVSYVGHLALFPKTEFMIHISVETLNGVFTILFDTAVFVAIFQNTFGLLQLQSGISVLQRNSLAKVLVQQGILRYGFVLTITLAGAVLRLWPPTFSKLAKPSRNPQPVPKYFDHSLSLIIICHFHLDLQQRNDHPNGTNTSQSLPLGSFHAVTERIDRAVVDEFGDLSFNESFGTEVLQEDTELQEIQSPSGVAEIGLQEFPWAGGDIGDEEAGPVASGEFLAYYGTVVV